MIELRLNELGFDPEEHIYRLNGVVIPSVTQIIKPISGAVYGSVNFAVLKQAAEKGTAVHQAIERFNTYGIDTVAEEYSGYMDAYKKWVADVQPEIEAGELHIYHKLLRYAGTVDLLAGIDGKLTLVDFKTSYAVVEKTNRLQLEAYEKALESFGIKVEDKYNLYLKKDGTYKIVRYPVRDTEAWLVFSACKTLNDYINK